MNLSNKKCDVSNANISGFPDEKSNSTLQDITNRSGVTDTLVTEAIQDRIVKSLGSVQMPFIDAPICYYYVKVNHRNSIETCCALPINIISGGSITYNFSSSQDQAFGNNQTLVNPGTGHYAIYNGDENQNGIVDLTDVVNVSNAANVFANGYKPLKPERL